MSKFIYLFVFLLLMLIGCQNSQTVCDYPISDDNPIELKNVSERNNNNKDPFNKEMIVKKFDIKTFKENREHSVYRFVTAKGIEVKQWRDYEYPSGETLGYIEERNYPNSPYIYYNKYDVNGNISKSGAYFFHAYARTGSERLYNSEGQVIREKNYDLYYPFSIEMLIDKMAVEYKIDLLDNSDENKKNVSRTMGDYLLHPLEYSVSIDSSLLEEYAIDGVTGKTLDMIQHLMLD